MTTPVVANVSQLRYLEHLWWVMHHSYLPDRQTFSLTSYMDDSGSDDLSPMTTIGGPIMSREAFMDFSDEWAKALRLYRVSQPLHMVDFVRPHGQHIGMRSEMKLALFEEISQVINKYKLYSLSIAVAGSDFNEQLPQEVRGSLIGPYGLAYFLAVLVNHGFSEHSRFHGGQNIAYLLDAGFPHSDQLYSVHASIIKTRFHGGKSCFIGSMTQDSDENVPALQAADVIAWSSRRRELNALSEEFAPLSTLLDDNTMHHHVPFPREGVQAFARPIRNWIASGVMPKLEDILRP